MSNTETMTGGEAMVRAAVANGIDTIFGLPGAQIYPLFDAIHQSSDVNAIISRHEQGAAYMAFGYASATGRPGAFSVVPGPGVLNTTLGTKKRNALKRRHHPVVPHAGLQRVSLFRHQRRIYRSAGRGVLQLQVRDVG